MDKCQESVDMEGFCLFVSFFLLVCVIFSFTFLTEAQGNKSLRKTDTHTRTQLNQLQAYHDTLKWVLTEMPIPFNETVLTLNSPKALMIMTWVNAHYCLVAKGQVVVVFVYLLLESFFVSAVTAASLLPLGKKVSLHLTSLIELKRL